jgi:hypothetical protein
MRGISISIHFHFQFRDPNVVTQAANVMLALCWKNTGNKARVATGGACPVLLKRIIRHAPLEDEPNVLCMERTCMALASLLIFRSNHEKFYGFPPFYFFYLAQISVEYKKLTVCVKKLSQEEYWLRQVRSLSH